MKISKSCFYCFARQICSLSNDERDGEVCRNFHKGVEEKFTPIKTQSKQCTCTNSCVSTIYVCKDCGGRVNSKR